MRRPQFAASGYKFDRIDMQKFIRQLRRCRVGDEIEVTPVEWLKDGGEPTNFAFLVDIDGDLIEFYDQCRLFKVQVIPAGIRDDPADLTETVLSRGMSPVGEMNHAVR